MGADRRAQPPVSLDVIAYQVGALQTSVDRGLAAMERTLERGLADMRVEVAGLAQRLATMEQHLVRIDTRVEALEQFRAEEEKRQQTARDRAEQRAETAEVDQSQLRMWRVIAVALLALVPIAAVVIALLQLLGQ